MTTGRKNAIDIHPQREEIIEQILKGDSFRGISLKYGFSDMSVARYVQNVLKKDIAIYLSQKSQESNFRSIEGCVTELEEIARLCKRLIAACEKELTENGSLLVGDSKRSTHAYLRGYLQELRATLESIGKFLGMVKDVTVVNNISVESSAFVSKVIGILEDNLSDQPELLQKIEDALNE